jgi:Cation transporter/ATPase, N-terminus
MELIWECRLFIMQLVAKKFVAEIPPLQPPAAKPPKTASASVPATLATLEVNPRTGLASEEVDIRHWEHGYNEVAEKGASDSQIP